jgi:hypothetical protein
MDRFKFTGVLLTTLGLTIGGIFFYIEVVRGQHLGDSSVLGVSEIKNILETQTQNPIQASFDLDQIKANLSQKCTDGINKDSNKLEYQNIKNVKLNSTQELLIVSCNQNKNAKNNVLVKQNKQYKLLSFESYNYQKRQINQVQDIELEINKEATPTKFQVFTESKNGFDCGQLSTYSWSAKDWRYELIKVKRKDCQGATVGTLNENYWNTVYP